MTRIRAFVVGVAKHAEARINVLGPEESAMRVAEWLLGLAGTTLEMHLFLSEDAVLTETIKAGMADNRVTAHRTTARDAIDSYARVAIGDDIKRRTRLFVFWSGHGVTCSSTDDRIFMCGDYSEQLPDRVFNASVFLRRMRSVGYPFADTLMLADVCGPFKLRSQRTYEDLEQTNKPQLSCFAAPAGAYAATPEAGGKFTATALEVLAREAGYPGDLERLADRLADALNTPDGVALRLMTSTGQKFTEQIVGGQAVAALTYFESAHTLLLSLDVPDDEYCLHYERTALALNFAPVARRSGLRAVLAHLCDLYDDIDVMPFGLLQFMMRLSSVAHYDEAIKKWLEAEAPGQQSARDKVLRLLETERRRLVVLFVVEEKNSVPDNVRPYLCGIDGSFSAGQRFASVKTQCKDWAEFEAIVRRTLDEFRAGETLPNLEVHFAVDAPLLDRPFHQIPLTVDGEEIGALAPVFLRHRTRLLNYEPDRFNSWQDYAAMLRTTQHGKLEWVKVGPALPLPAQQGMCYAAFAMPHPPAGAALSIPQKRILNRLLLLGAPILYVPHAAPPTADWDAVGDELGDLTKGLSQVDSFAKAFHHARVRGIDLARNASLLWDDPHNNPFPPTYGTSDT